MSKRLYQTRRMSRKCIVFCISLVLCSVAGAKPRVANVQPSEAPPVGGTLITVAGNYFTNTQLTCRFGRVYNERTRVEFSDGRYVSSTKVICPVPEWSYEVCADPGCKAHFTLSNDGIAFSGGATGFGGTSQKFLWIVRKPILLRSGWVHNYLYSSSVDQFVSGVPAGEEPLTGTFSLMQSFTSGCSRMIDAVNITLNTTASCSVTLELTSDGVLLASADVVIGTPGLQSVVFNLSSSEVSLYKGQDSYAIAVGCTSGASLCDAAWPYSTNGYPRGVASSAGMEMVGSDFLFQVLMRDVYTYYESTAKVGRTPLEPFEADGAVGPTLKGPWIGGMSVFIQGDGFTRSDNLWCHVINVIKSVQQMEGPISHPVLPSAPVAQSFAAVSQQTSATLQRVELYLRLDSPKSVWCTLSVGQGASTSGLTTILATERILVRANITMDGMVDFAFASPPALVTGEVYFLQLSTEVEGIRWQRSDSDLLPFGAAYNTTGGALTMMDGTNTTGCDMSFQLWTTTPTISNGPSYNVPAHFINRTRVACTVPANNVEAIDVQNAMFKVSNANDVHYASDGYVLFSYHVCSESNPTTMTFKFAGTHNTWVPLESSWAQGFLAPKGGDMARVQLGLSVASTAVLRITVVEELPTGPINSTDIFRNSDEYRFDVNYNFGYINRTIGNCDGYLHLETAEECAAAAGQLDKADRTVSITAAHNKPYGCFYQEDGSTDNKLWFNPNGDRTDDDTERVSLCKNMADVGYAPITTIEVGTHSIYLRTRPNLVENQTYYLIVVLASGTVSLQSSNGLEGGNTTMAYEQSPGGAFEARPNVDLVFSFNQCPGCYVQAPVIADDYAVDIGKDIYLTSETQRHTPQTVEQDRSQAAQSFTAEYTGLINTVELDLAVTLPGLFSESDVCLWITTVAPRGAPGYVDLTNGYKCQPVPLGTDGFVSFVFVRAPFVQTGTQYFMTLKWGLWFETTDEWGVYPTAAGQVEKMHHAYRSGYRLLGPSSPCQWKGAQGNPFWPEESGFTGQAYVKQPGDESLWTMQPDIDLGFKLHICRSGLPLVLDMEVENAPMPTGPWLHPQRYGVSARASPRGGSKLIVHGYNFFPSTHLRCRFHYVDGTPGPLTLAEVTTGDLMTATCPTPVFDPYEGVDCSVVDACMGIHVTMTNDGLNFGTPLGPNQASLGSNTPKLLISDLYVNSTSKYNTIRRRRSELNEGAAGDGTGPWTAPGSDTMGDGTLWRPYQTLQKAISVATNMDGITVMGTSISGENNIGLKHLGKDIVVRALPGLTCTINCSYSVDGVVLRSASDQQLWSQLLPNAFPDQKGNLAFESSIRLAECSGHTTVVTPGPVLS